MAAIALVPLVLLIGFGVLGTWYPVPGLVGAIAVLVVAPAGYGVLMARRRVGLGRWATANGWTPVGAGSRGWPWEGLALNGKAEAGRAWAREDVTFGEVRWSGGAFAGAVPQREGHGVFVVIRLPESQPGMAMRLPYVVVGDSPRLQRPKLREAFLSGEIPPWTVRDRELFTVEAVPVEAAAAQRAIGRARRIAGLLDLDGDSYADQ